MVKMVIPVIQKSAGDSDFTGTGDLLSAMLLAQTNKYPDDFGKAVEISVNIVHGVLHRSI